MDDRERKPTAKPVTQWFHEVKITVLKKVSQLIENILSQIKIM